MYRSPGVFVGYYKNEEATRENQDQGWLGDTGDAGFFDRNGHLKIIDRAKDVGKLNDGALFAPKYIENKLKFFPNIKEAVAFGDGRDFCDRVPQYRPDIGGQLGRAQQRQLCQPTRNWRQPASLRDDGKHVDQVNRDLAGRADDGRCADQARFLVLHKELDADDGETDPDPEGAPLASSPSAYAPLIDALYDGSTSKHRDRSDLRGRPQGRH
jgi:long-chain acyl-CoA synthetase